MNASQPFAAAIATVIAFGTFFAADASQAQEATPDHWVAASVASRQAVRLQTLAARSAGMIASGEAQDHDFALRAQPMLSRAQVRAEAIEAQRLGLTQGGELQRMASAEDSARIERAGRAAAQMAPTMAARASAR